MRFGASGELASSNAGLAVNLAEKAFRRRVKRAVSSGSAQGDLVLAAADFGMDDETWAPKGIPRVPTLLEQMPDKIGDLLDQLQAQHPSLDYDALRMRFAAAGIRDIDAKFTNERMVQIGIEATAREIILRGVSSRQPTVLMQLHDQCPSFDWQSIKQKFVDAAVTDDLVGDLDDSSLVEIGVARKGDRMRIMKALREHRLLAANSPEPSGKAAPVAAAYATQKSANKAVRVATESKAETRAETVTATQASAQTDSVSGISVEEALDRLRLIGVCEAGYAWLQVPDERAADSARCDVCSGVVDEGFNCQAGGHWVCWSCVEDFVPDT
eukprot:SAG31_NODE_203_length_20490_cov_7.713256_5_plen_327_part_00